MNTWPGDTPSKVNRDFSDLFAAFADAAVEYLLVGGYALAYHGAPRFTKDIDLWVRPSEANAARTLSALQAFGAPTAGLTVHDLARDDTVFQIGLPPNRIDILTGVDGLDFDAAWTNRERCRYGDQSLFVISRRDLIQNKRATGRPRDLLDANDLERADTPATTPHPSDDAPA